MAPVRPVAAAPTNAPAVFLRSNLRVSPLPSAEDSTVLRLDETEFLRTFGMRHLTHLVFLQDTSCAAQYASGRICPPKCPRMRRIITPTAFFRKVVVGG